MDKRLAALGAGFAILTTAGIARAYTGYKERAKSVEERLSALEAGMTQLGVKPEVYGWVDRMEERVTALEGKAGKLESDLSALATRLGTDQQRIATLEGKLSADEGRISTLESSVSDILKRLAGDESRISSLETAVAGLRSDVDRQGGVLSSHETRISGLEARVSALEARVSEVLKRLDDIESALAYACYKAQEVDKILPPPRRVSPPGIVVALTRKHGYPE
jgi:chromosome segregation ATPase